MRTNTYECLAIILRSLRMVANCIRKPIRLIFATFWRICREYIFLHSQGYSPQCESSIRGNFVYMVAQYTVRWTAKSDLHFTHWQTCFSSINSTYLGSILITQQLRAKTIHSHFHHCVSIGGLSLIQLGELVVSWRERRCPNFGTVATDIRIRAILITGVLRPPPWPSG